MSIEASIAQAQALEASGNLEEAAQLLLSLNFESAQRTYADTLKMETHLKAADLCIRLDRIDEAETQVNRASMLQTSVNNDALITKYKSLYAIVLDRNGRFAEAATRYFELSLKSQLSEEETVQVLQNAITCTILAPRGQQKQRLLMNLFKDDRCSLLTGYDVVKEMYLERFIKPEQLIQFQTMLKPHQQKREQDGLSILEQTTIESNILSLARVYKNISFDSLEQLLRIPKAVIEKMLTRMISADLLSGTIDQPDQTVVFEANDMNWNDYIVSVCDQVTKVNDLIVAAKQGGQ